VKPPQAAGCLGYHLYDLDLCAVLQADLVEEHVGVDVSDDLAHSCVE